MLPNRRGRVSVGFLVAPAVGVFLGEVVVVWPGFEVPVVVLFRPSLLLLWVLIPAQLLFFLAPFG